MCWVKVWNYPQSLLVLLVVFIVIITQPCIKINDTCGVQGAEYNGLLARYRTVVKSIIIP